MKNDTNPPLNAQPSPQLEHDSHDGERKKVEGESVCQIKRFGNILRRDKVEEERVKYFEALRRFNEGDVLLFKTRRVMSKLQRLVLHSEFDHIGIVVQWDKCSNECCSPALKKSRAAAGIAAWHTLEADSNGVSLYRITPGCLSAYRGKCFVRHLELDPMVFDAEKKRDLRRNLHAFTSEMYGRPYEKRVIEMLRAANIFGGNKKEDLSSVFCSELVAAAYHRMGLLPQSRTSNSYVPGDFSSVAKKKRAVDLAPGVSLSQEYLLDVVDLGTYSSPVLKTESASARTENAAAPPVVSTRRSASTVSQVESVDASKRSFEALLSQGITSRGSSLRRTPSRREGRQLPINFETELHTNLDRLFRSVSIETVTSQSDGDTSKEEGG